MPRWGLRASDVVLVGATYQQQRPYIYADRTTLTFHVTGDSLGGMVAMGVMILWFSISAAAQYDNLKRDSISFPI